jgi:general secretion pathway protein J
MAYRLSRLIREHSTRAGFRHLQSGFTLIEILIAIFIFSVVLTTIYTSYTGTFRVIDETESQAKTYRMARIAMERILEDLESVYIPEREEYTKSGEEQDLGAAEIGYYVKENGEGEDFALYRIDRPVFEEAFPSEEETGGFVLCERLVSVNFTYYEENDKVVENWDSASDALKDKIPKMVSISLEFVNSADPETPFRFMTSVALPIEQGYSW